MEDIFCEAIETQKRVKINYKGTERVIEPHTFGYDNNGFAKVRASQARGYSESGNFDLKLFIISKMDNVQLLNETFSVNSFYRAGSDKGIHDIICQIQLD